MARYARHGLCPDNEGQPVGLLAYVGDQPIGWCSVAPAHNWSAPAPRRPGNRLIANRFGRLSAILYTRHTGSTNRYTSLASGRELCECIRAEVIEAYPKDLGHAPLSAKDTSLYFGTVEMYLALGFAEVVRRSAAFPIMRLQVR